MRVRGLRLGQIFDGLEDCSGFCSESSILGNSTGHSWL